MVKREKNGLNKYIKQCVRDRARRRVLIALLAICAALVAGGVAYEMIKPAITVTAQPICGMQEHVHSQDCYETHLVCGLEEGPEHTHEESCYATVLVCTQTQHTHEAACYPEELAEPTLSAEEGTEETNAPAADTEAPQETLTPEPTEEAAAPQPQILELQGTVSLPAGQAGQWKFAAQDAEKAAYVIENAEGETVAAGELPAAGGELECVIEKSGLYTLKVTAFAGAQQHQAAWPFAVTDGPLQAETAAQLRSCFGGDEIVFTLKTTGGVAPVKRHVTIWQGDQVLFDEEDCTQDQVRVTAQTWEDVSEITARVQLTDATGAACQAETALPCAVRKTETARQWEKTMARVELQGVWPEDLLAIARTQLGYRESTTDFIIDADGSQKGYTRYGR